VPAELDERDRRFLADTRLGILSTPSDDWPLSIPVWFEWAYDAVQLFSFGTAPKVARLRAEPRASFLVVNHLDEPEHWVAIDGKAVITGDGFPLAERLAPRYWDLDDPAHADTIEQWRSVADQFVRITIRPQRIRHHT
jgi:nitroimidazol reductase NimA-like FMN-containing flavoprotein (pyridoxamine 5'-phosphate oxidase superfamily)